MTIRIAIICAILLAALTACSTAEPLPELEKPPIASGKEFDPHIITPQQAVQITDRHLAVASWAFTVSKTARQTPSLFPAALFTAPADQCVRAFKQFHAENANADSKRLTDCHLALYEHGDPEEWYRRLPQEREGRVRIGVGYLWQSIDPREFTAAFIANTRAVDIKRSEDPAYDQFHASYAPCDLIADQAVETIYRTDDASAMAQAWLTAYQQLSDCSASITEVLFKP